MAKSKVHSEETVLSLMWRRSLFQDGCRQAGTLPASRVFLGIEGDILWPCTIVFQESSEGTAAMQLKVVSPGIGVMALCIVMSLKARLRERQRRIGSRPPATECDFHVRVDPDTATIRTTTEAVIRRPGRSKAARDKAQRYQFTNMSEQKESVDYCSFLPAERRVGWPPRID
jgi:hypothetical protein